MQFRIKFAVAALTVAALTGTAATAFAADASKSENLNTKQTATAPPSDLKIGPQAGLKAHRYAVVAQDGTLARGRNAFGSAQVSGGTYEVFFDRDVTNCAYEATIGTTSIGDEPAGSITVASRFGQPTAVWVDTSNVDGSDGLRAFQLEVIC